MDIDWQRVPNERRKDAEKLNSRLEKYETGFIDRYGNKIAAVSTMMAYLQEHLNVANNAIDEMLPVTGQMFAELDASYDTIDLGELPLNDYTRPFYVCASLHFDLKRTYDVLKEQIDSGEDITESLYGIKETSQKIIDISRESCSYFLTTVLKPLKAMSHGDNPYKETLFYKHYLHEMALIHTQSGITLHFPEVVSETISLMEKAFKKIDTIHTNMGLDDSDTENIASKLTSPDLYSHLRETYETLKEQIDTGEDITGSLDDLKKTSHKIIKIGKEAHFYLLTSVLNPLDAVSGGDNRNKEISFVHYYARKFASISAQAQCLPDCFEELSEALHLMEKEFQEIDNIHHNMGLGNVPLNADTEYFFTCRPLYLQLMEAYKAFEELTPVLNELEESAKTLKKDSKAIVDHARPKYQEMITEVLNPLKSIPGCENRILHKKRPKNT